MPIKPISPSEAREKLGSTIPDRIINAFNKMIIAKFDGKVATFTQDEILAKIVNSELSSATIFKNHWLDIEPLFRTKGWTVEYDKPAYNENYSPRFMFKHRS